MSWAEAVEAQPGHAVQIEDLEVRFGGLVAVRDFAMTVAPGAIHALIGPNGAGKTSVLNCISGVYRPARGRIVVGGQDVVGWPAHRITTLQIARVFQHVGFFRHLSVLDSILLGRHLHFRYGLLSAATLLGAARREETHHRAVVERVIDFLEMEAVRKEPVGALPYGLQKRVELARALAMEPRLLLLDEPTIGMNREEKEDMVRFMLDVRAELGATILIIDHDMRVVMDIADRVTVMHFGQRLADGTPVEVAANPEVVRAYLGNT